MKIKNESGTIFFIIVFLILAWAVWLFYLDNNFKKIEEKIDFKPLIDQTAKYETKVI